jgi:hypothetical protein
VTPTTVSFRYPKGLINVPLERLPPDLVARSHYNPTAAEKPRQSEATNAVPSGGITGAFGLKFGTKVEQLERYPAFSAGAEGLRYIFVPVNPVVANAEYSFEVTPLTHLVYAIEMLTKKYESDDEACAQTYAVKNMLEKKYGETMTLHEDTQRERELFEVGRIQHWILNRGDVEVSLFPPWCKGHVTPLGLKFGYGSDPSFSLKYENLLLRLQALLELEEMNKRQLDQQMEQQTKGKNDKGL